jgi:hypothetical protein
VRRLLPLATMLFLAGCAVSNTGEVPQPSPTASPSASPSEPTSSSSPAAGAIRVDDLVRSTVDGLTVRASAGTSGAQLGTINSGQLGFVLAGPLGADGYTWYQLSALGLPPNADCPILVSTTPFNCPTWHGWVAAGAPGGPAWLETTTLACPASPMNVEALVNGATAGPRTGLERLACYGSTSIRVRGWFPKIPEGAGLGGACQANPPSTWWLECSGLNYNGLVVSESAGFGSPGLQISIDPASGLKMPPRGQWVEVAGHLDDPAARTCAPRGAGEDPVIVVLGCRSEFAAESISAVSGPY